MMETMSDRSMASVERQPKGSGNDSASRIQEEEELKQKMFVLKKKRLKRRRLALVFVISGAVMSLVTSKWFASRAKSNECSWWWKTDDNSSPMKEEFLSLHTHFTPLDSQAFSSFIDSKASRLSLHGVLSWKTAAVSWWWVPSCALAILIPPNGIHANVGYVWRLLPETPSEKFISSNWHTPPLPSEPMEKLLFQLLSMFHPRPFLESRYGPRGGVATVRAKTEDTLDIWFRLHPEYQLNIPPRLPLWFTPAAFIGRLIINMTDLSAVHFHMWVPSQRSLNVDLEWLTGPNEEEDMEVTITRVADMSVRSQGQCDNPDAIPWKEKVTEEETLMLLQREMYQFMQVNYYNYSEALVKASREGRPVHLMVLWGALDDQSC